ncbi:MAG TPA: TonB-dependent receptor [Burkholderiales bacterium]|nr:TonB-dependent receptor [Burkholderiales bacterium]
MATTKPQAGPRLRPFVMTAMFAAVAMALPGLAVSQDNGQDLAELSLEQLSNIDVTSVSKKSERLIDAAASIFVITHDDIRRSGAKSLGEALRLAPNLQVAQTSADTFAISARGFNNSNALANKLLVLIDGRTVYSPDYSGVFWDQQDVMLEDVDRIEVISGPGGTLWGANAVNGVINVITKPAGTTQGALVSLGGGDSALGGAVRYGSKLGETGHFRVYAKASDFSNTQNAAGTALTDGWTTEQMGFRADWGSGRRDFTLQGDAYTGRGDDRPVAGPVTVDGFNLLARWNERFDSGSDLQLQAYFDRSDREDHAGFQGDADTYDIEFQNGIPIGAHKILWGGGYRTAHDTVQATSIPFAPLVFLVTTFQPESANLEWENLFVQDEISLTAALKLTLGVKFEHNDYTGWENLPSARLAWKPTDDQLVWGAVSRTVRAPARLDRDFFLNISVPILNINQPAIVGGPNFVSEVANVSELGYRAQAWNRVTYSITAFYSDYDRLRSGEPPPAMIQNRIQGDTYGVEAWATFQATDTWRLSGGLMELRKNLHEDAGVIDPDGVSNQGNDPEHQWLLRSSLNLTPHHDFDVMVRGVSGLPDPVVPGYTAIDARLAWRPQPNTELSATVRNLFDPGHVEFGDPATASEVARSFFLKAVMQF